MILLIVMGILILGFGPMFAIALLAAAITDMAGRSAVNISHRRPTTEEQLANRARNEAATVIAAERQKRVMRAQKRQRRNANAAVRRVMNKSIVPDFPPTI